MSIKKYIVAMAFGMLVVSVQGQTPHRLYFHTTLQYAGSVGFVSMGGGLSNKKNTLEQDLLYGFLPRRYGGETHKITYKFSVQPFQAKLSERVTWKIINPGAFFSYNIGKSFGLTHDKEKYPKGYYWWSPALRAHISFSTALYVDLNKEKGSKLMLYMEANSNDRYLTSYFSNTKEIPFWDIWYLGFGGKYIFGRN